MGLVVSALCHLARAARELFGVIYSISGLEHGDLWPG